MEHKEQETQQVREYEKPRIEDYGDLHEFTASTAQVGPLDENFPNQLFHHSG